MSVKKILGGNSNKKWLVLTVIAAVVLLLAGIMLGLWLSGFRYMNVKYLSALDGNSESIQFLGFLSKDGVPKNGTVYFEGKTASLSHTEEGKFRLEYNNGDVYEGELSGFQRQGTGDMRYASGDSYVGEFSADKLHGTGIYSYASGDSYEGTFRSGKKSGEGKYTWTYENGTAVYEGHFENDRRNGYGVFTAVDGTVYKGNFLNDLRTDTQAEVEIPNSNGGVDRYYGGYDKDVRSGFGYYFYANGDVYIGQFAANLPEGEGTVYFAKGGSYKGQFIAGNIDRDNATEIPSEEASKTLSSLDPEENPFKRS